MNPTIKRLRETLQPLADKGIALAFSGGVDSTFLLAVLAEMQKAKPFPLNALYMKTAFQSDDELVDVKRISAQFEVKLVVFEFNPLELPEISCNPLERCYFCKCEIFRRFADFSARNELGILMDGTNGDDEHFFRPGRRALREFEVVSPLAELKIGKAAIREMCAEMRLECAEKPSVPCLATRFEYGTKLSKELIQQVSEGEKLIRGYLKMSDDLRLRVHGQVARIEVIPSNFPVILQHKEEITNGLKKLGFQYITLDLAGFRSGSFDSQYNQKER